MARHAGAAVDRALALEWLIRSPQDLTAAGEFLMAGGDLGRLNQLLGATTGPEADRMRVWVLGLHARLAIERGARDEAGRALGQAVALSRARADPGATAEALLGLAEIALEHGDLGRLLLLAREAEDLLHRLPDRAAHGQLQPRLAYLAAAEARCGDAEPHYREARRLFREAGLPMEAAKNRMGLP